MVERLEAWLQTTEFRVKVDDERSRRGVRDCAFDGGGAAWRRGVEDQARRRAGGDARETTKTHRWRFPTRAAPPFVITREALSWRSVRRAEDVCLVLVEVHQRTVR